MHKLSIENITMCAGYKDVFIFVCLKRTVQVSSLQHGTVKHVFSPHFVLCAKPLDKYLVILNHTGMSPSS